MGKGRAGGMLGVGGTRSHVPRKAMHGGRAGRADGPGQGLDAAAQKRELLRKLRESRT
ncbi:DUF6243 family protein [Streptomyces sp. 549]|uniref:DUF6243 family protein n=1 Tax=Streptomyces sp. 549 TaxID=3049076 RepID=UPI0024C4334C|nr:DUF6243 family protein [Streptomyces sp. 549]MDK1474041.1 DUF6243 family protein [Streptomyces sp. 549]